jgi:hypothetical protein
MHTCGNYTVQQIESVQREYTKLIPEFARPDCGSRLAALNVDSLELWRRHLDFISACKTQNARIVIRK